jgi:hypothetical protein
MEVIMKQQGSISMGFGSTGAGGSCSVALPQRDLREPKPRPAVPQAPKPDGAVWAMRFLALALVLFVGVLLVLYG